MPYRPEAIANAFLIESFMSDKPIDPMKSQKLVYFAHGYYLALTGRALVNEYFQAWKLGPVLPSLYQELKSYGGRYIDDLLKVGLGNNRQPAILKLRDDTDFDRVRDFVWRTYQDYGAIQLSNLTHKVGDAWDRTIKANPGFKGPPIPNEEIKKDFVSLVRVNDGIRANT